jgi:hypothetical protein
MVTGTGTSLAVYVMIPPCRTAVPRKGVVDDSTRSSLRGPSRSSSLASTFTGTVWPTSSTTYSSFTTGGWFA